MTNPTEALASAPRTRTPDRVTAAATPDPTTDPTADPTTHRPTGLRRTGVVVAGLLACALPVLFTVNLTRMLLLGVEPDHRFHQLTGQGVLLFVVGLAALLPLVRAGWAGRRPAPHVGLHHLAFVGVGAALSVAAPGGGAPALMAVLAATGAVLWLAVPRRPVLRGLQVRLDPLLAPVALLSAALWTPYAVGQVRLQNAATGYHAENPHHFDMAWLVVVLVVLAVLAALLPAARGLVRWTAAGSVVVGAAGLVLTDETGWSLLALGLGVVAAVAAVVQPRLDRRAGSHVA